MTDRHSFASTKLGRVATTSVIWGTATGMVALCIPMLAFTPNSVIVPLAVLLGATIGTVSIWRNAAPTSEINLALLVSLKELEQRVSNLEVIRSSDSPELQKLHPPNPED